MAYSIGQANWALTAPEPQWKHENEYKKQYKTLLTKLRSAVQSAAKDDIDRCTWLINQIRIKVHDGILTARKHDSDDDSAV